MPRPRRRAGPEAGPGADAAHEVGVGIRVVEDGVDADAGALSKTRPLFERSSGEPEPDQLLGLLAVRGRDLERSVRRRQRGRRRSGVEELARAVDDEAAGAAAARSRSAWRW